MKVVWGVRKSCWDLIVVEFYLYKGGWVIEIRHVNDRGFFFFLDLEVIWMFEQVSIGLGREEFAKEE